MSQRSKWLRETVGKDLSRTEAAASRAEVWKGYWRFPTFRLIYWLRVCQSYPKHSFGYCVGYLFLKHYRSKLGIAVNPATPIGEGFCVVHGGTVYLNARSIGKNCTFYHGVTLGTKCAGDEGRPTIEDGVTVYTGAVVVGGITLHEGCVIGANSVVTKDVPAHTLAAGAPARIVKEL